jgi:phosphatidate cytidylyltransferase
MTLPPGIYYRAISTLALWGAVLALVFSGWALGVWLLIAGFGLAGQWEFYSAQEDKKLDVPIYKWSGLACGALLFINTYCCLVWRPQYSDAIWIGESMLIVLVVVGALVRMVLAGPPRSIISIALTVLGFVYAPLLFNYVAKIAFLTVPMDQAAFHPATTHLFLLYLLAVTKFTDVGAFIMGSLCGRHKMIPHVSPGKTWEGFAGGIATAIIVSMLMQHYCHDQLGGMTQWAAALLGVILALASTVGDLAESVIKRDAHIKDSGHTIPGIGGALDLIDSILFTAPVLYFYLYFVQLA